MRSRWSRRGRSKHAGNFVLPNATTPRRFADRIRELVAGHVTLETIAAAMLSAHEVLLREFNGAADGSAPAIRRGSSRRRLREPGC
jgi:hypothetical protein